MHQASDRIRPNSPTVRPNGTQISNLKGGTPSLSSPSSFTSSPNFQNLSLSLHYRTLSLFHTHQLTPTHSGHQSTIRDHHSPLLFTLFLFHSLSLINFSSFSIPLSQTLPSFSLYRSHLGTKTPKQPHHSTLVGVVSSSIPEFLQTSLSNSETR